MIKLIQRLGAQTIRKIKSVGSIALFLVSVLLHSGTSFSRIRLTIRQIYFSGVLSILIVSISGLFIGMVLGLQIYTLLVQFKAADALGFAVAVSLLREIGPVLAGLLFASSAGSAITSEIGLMKATEQIEAMRVMGVNPISRIVAPRFWAGIISMPILASLCNLTGIIGAYFVGVIHLGLDGGVFWGQMQAGIDLNLDVINGLIKSGVFGVAICLIAVYQGFNCKPTPEGILRATTRTVVMSSLTILALDFILTAFMFTG